MEAGNSGTCIIYSSISVFIALGWHSENDYGVLLMNILTRTMNTNQDYEYYACIFSL